ncbi:MAG: protein kinase [Gemmatimonadaceae bacterium]|nr:protein kinase [Gemmatimonadaceae bacterium]
MHDAQSTLAQVAVLFGELAELTPEARLARLSELAESAPNVAREVRALLDIDAGGGDFLGLFTMAPGPRQPDNEIPLDNIGPYRLVREIGRGGMGSVWLAHDDRLARALALKFLPHVDDAESGAAREQRSAMRSRFLVEARAAAALDHPHVASVYDVGMHSDGRLFIAMAYCSGGSLAQRLESGPMPSEDAVRIATQIASALAAAHERGVVHRDVKPANVLFDAAGNARLADFGIASLPGYDATRTGAVMGTLAYLAPEQMRGERADHRADLWALGVTLYEMLAGKRPFAGESPASLMHAVLHLEPPSLDELAPTVSPSVRALAKQLLSKTADERPLSMADVEAVLRNASETSGSRFFEVVRETTAPPMHLNALIGRERDLEAVAQLLSVSRLVTLTGAGGSGKTRLAAAIGAAQRAVWVDFSASSDPWHVPAQIAAALRVPEMPGRERLDVLVDAIGSRDVLLVLDNCEHMLDAIASAVERLLHRCAGMRILATSREALGLPGERAWLVPELSRDNARALFVQRAQSAQPQWELTAADASVVDEICARLDGLPLAIELAAARSRLLSPTQIRERLDDAFQLLTGGARTALPRHRTLRGTMEWSHALLSERERTLLRRLSVFAGGFTLLAAEVVCVDASLPSSPGTGRLLVVDILDGVSSLVDKSLVLADTDANGTRYRLLETVRQYGRERLAEAGELPHVEWRHAHWVMALVESQEWHLQGGETKPGVMAEMVREHDNIRAALLWATTGDPSVADRGEMGLRMISVLFWYLHGASGWLGTAQYSDGVRFITAALARDPRRDVRMTARGWLTSGLFGLATGSWEQGITHMRIAIDLFHQLEDRWFEGWAKAWSGAILLMLGRLREAWDVLADAQRIADSMGPSVLQNVIYSWSGLTARTQGRYDEARRIQEANVALGSSNGHSIAHAHSLAFLGTLDLLEQRIEDALEHFQQAFAMHVRMHDGWGLSLDLDGFAGIAALRGDPMAAASLYGAVDAWRERVGVVLPSFEIGDRESRVAQVRETLGDTFDRCYEEGRQLSPEAAARLVVPTLS